VRILYVHHRPELGGAPQSLSYLLAALDRERFEPHVYCPPGPASDGFEGVGATVHRGPVAGFTHIWASTYSGRRWLLLARELSKLPRHAAALRRTLAANSFALVHLNDSPLVASAAIARRAGIPVVWHLRSALPRDGRDQRSRAIRYAIRRFGSAAIAINEDIAAVYDVGAEVVPNTVDTGHFVPADATRAKQQLGLPADLPIAAYFGFIYPSKGLREFIEAAAILRAQRVGARFLVVGGDVRGEHFFDTGLGRALRAVGLVQNYEQEAKALVARLGLSDLVRFVPFTQDTARLYQASDVVVAPSRGPELGRPVLEAAACGRPVIASGSLNGGGVVLPGETALLVPRRSPEVLAAALGSLLEDEQLRRRLGESAREHAERTFSIRANAERVMEIYERVLRSP
jgi:glycosyltransferase involved in cell wall biosynthesis